MITKTIHNGRMAAAGAAMMLLLLAPQPRPAASDAGSTRVIVYKLKKGEGFSDVARKYGVPLTTIIKMNSSRLARPNDPSYVFPGMNVKVPVRAAPAKPAATPKPAASVPVTPPAAPPPAKPAAVPPAPQPAASVPAAPAPVPPAKTAVQQPAPVPAASAPAAARTRWLPAALAIASAAALALVLIVWYYLRRMVQDLSALRAGEHGPLTLVAQRELSKDASIYWIRVGEKDLFITTGADTRISATDPAAGLETEDAPADAAAPAPAANRRPRKEPPGIAAL